MIDPVLGMAGTIATAALIGLARRASRVFILEVRALNAAGRRLLREALAMVGKGTALLAEGERFEAERGEMFVLLRQLQDSRARYVWRLCHGARCSAGRGAIGPHLLNLSG